ncbi:MAG TPA: hypothetical protein VFJ30_03510 [Phycisphaerae bacterium]|nr:hypothetical protein [Phycisphaerae bacterium]
MTRTSVVWIGLTCLALAAAAGAGEVSGIVLTTDRTVDASSAETIAAGVCRPDRTPQQNAYSLWKFFVQRNRHKEKAPEIDPGNPAELMNRTGYALCGTWANLWAEAATAAGFQATRVGLQGHWVGAVEYWGDWHTYDIDMLAVYAKADGIVAAPGEIRRLKDPATGQYVLRNGPPVKSFPWYMGSDSIAGVAALYSNASLYKPYEKRPWKWTYNLRLRPGAELTWSWYGDPDIGFACISHLPDVRSKKTYKSLREYLEGDFDYYTQTDGKPTWSWGYRRGGLPGNPLSSWNGINGNGRLTYDLGKDGFRYALQMAESAENLKVEAGRLALADPAKAGVLVLDFALPYPYGDAFMDKPLPAEGLKVELSTPRTKWREVYPRGGVDDDRRIRLFDLVRGQSDVKLRLTLAAGTAPLAGFRAVGVFHHNFMVLPALLTGDNAVSLRCADADALKDDPIHVTYVYDQATDDRKILRHEKVLTFAPGKLTQHIDTGGRHWPLMREIRMVCGGGAPKAAAPAAETGELDWSAAPWEWAYCGVNFWNDFERGDRHGWRGKLTTANTSGGSDFALDNSLMSADGSRQLKLIRYGSFLNRDSRFRCRLFINHVKHLWVYSRNQGDAVYYGKYITDLKQGQWQTVEFAFNDLVSPTDPAKRVENNWFLSNVYMVAPPAEGKENKDVEFLVDDILCYDGELKHDPFQDPAAPVNARAEDLIWTAAPRRDAGE